MKFVIFAIFAIFVAQNVSHSRKNSCYFCDFFQNLRTSRSPSWTFLFLSSILLNLLFLLFLLLLLLNLFTLQGKFLFFLGFVQNWRTSRSPSWPFLFVKVEFWRICYCCYFCHTIFVTQSFHIARNILLTFAIFATFAISSILFWYSSILSIFFAKIAKTIC